MAHDHRRSNRDPGCAAKGWWVMLGTRKTALSAALQEWRWCAGKNISDEERLERALANGIAMAECVADQQYKRANWLHETLQQFAVWDEKRGEYVAKRGGA